MERKDYFSGQSKTYAAFRPTYPRDLYDFIFKHLRERNAAWDCATGNGQVARYLAPQFKEVYATDISKSQIDEAFQAENVFYSVCPAEKTSFPLRGEDGRRPGEVLNHEKLSHSALHLCFVVRNP